MIFNYSIFKVNKNGLWLVNKYELNSIIYIIRNNQELFSIKKRRLYIPKD